MSYLLSLSSSLASETGLQRTRIKVTIFLEFRRSVAQKFCPPSPRGWGKFQKHRACEQNDAALSPVSRPVRLEELQKSNREHALLPLTSLEGRDAQRLSRGIFGALAANLFLSAKSRRRRFRNASHWGRLPNCICQTKLESACGFHSEPGRPLPLGGRRHVPRASPRAREPTLCQAAVRGWPAHRPSRVSPRVCCRPCRRSSRCGSPSDGGRIS